MPNLFRHLMINEEGVQKVGQIFFELQIVNQDDVFDPYIP